MYSAPLGPGDIEASRSGLPLKHPASICISANFCGLNTGTDHGPGASHLGRSPYRGHATCNDRGPSRAHPIGDSGQDPRTPSSFGMQMESFATIRSLDTPDQFVATGPRNTLNWFPK